MKQILPVIGHSKPNKSHQWLIFIIISAHFTHLFTYLGIVVHPSLSPLIFIVATIGVMTALVSTNPKSLNYIFRVPLYRWLLFYVVISLIWMILPNSHAAPKDMRIIILSAAFLFAVSSIIYFDDSSFTITRTALLVVTIISASNNILEFFNPTLFVPEGAESKIIGRSAGLYINANQAGVGILLGMIFSYALVPQKLKLLFLLLCLIGIISTFSRTSIAAWFMIVFIMIFTRSINKKTAVSIGISLFISATILLPILVSFLDINLESGANNLINRLDFFSSNKYEVDASQQERINIAKGAFRYFEDNPLLGGGLALTRYWEFQVSAHNMYLVLMAERGIIGFFIYPLFILSAVWKAKGEARKIALAFGAYVTVIGFTSHNILDSYHTLIAFSLMAGLSYRSRYQHNEAK